jgi:inorganic triphosphatase YgiF
VTQEHLEIEQKFDVDEDFARPDFGAPGALPGGVAVAAPVMHHLAATYFDTTDERLAASKITLRRRTGGTDEGWHMKLPAGQDSRRELHVPLTQGQEVPHELAALVAEITDGRPLAPIAVLDTERTVVTVTDRDGRAVAEIADDVVTARRLTGDAAGAPLRWREIEVEVPVAAPELQRAAAGLLRVAGARPAGHGSKLARVLGR